MSQADPSAFPAHERFAHPTGLTPPDCFPVEIALTCVRSCQPAQRSMPRIHGSRCPGADIHVGLRESLRQVPDALLRCRGRLLLPGPRAAPRAPR